MKKLIKISFVLIVSFLTTYTKAEVQMLFIGDSLTAGYGIAKEKAFPSLIAEKFKEKKLDVKILNGGVSGSTSASVESRLRWYLKAKPNILFLAIGANDGLRGVKASATKENIKKTIELALSNKIEVILAGMKLPPNYGKDYIMEFEEIYPSLAKKYKLTYLPFLLEGVAANTKFNQEDGIHPNEQGHQIVANHVFDIVYEVVEKMEKK